MKNSKSLDDLHPVVRDKATIFLKKCKDVGIYLLVTSTLRDFEAQTILYAQGRTAPGAIVTKAKAGESMHNYALAFDVVPVADGKPVWGSSSTKDLALWNKVGTIGEECGLEWAGRWKSFPELAHFQYTGGLTLADLQAGKRI